MVPDSASESSGPDMPVRLGEPEGFPTPASLAEDGDWQALLGTQLADTRKIAENWRTGLAALLGLVTVFSAVKGEAAISGLEFRYAVATGVLLLMGVCVAVIGALASLRAAYGTPRAVSRGELLSTGGLPGYRYELACQAVSDLRWARWTTLTSLVCIIAAISVTWYGPRPAQAIIDVERTGSPHVCGKLVASADGYIDIELSSAEATRIANKDILSINAVSEC